MARRERVKDLGKIKIMLGNIKRLNGVSNHVTIGVKDNGGYEDNPAYYGNLLETGKASGNTGRDYRFLYPSLVEDDTPLLGNEDIDKYLSIVKVDGKRRGRKQMIEAAQLYGEAAINRVREYILYKAPQYPDRGHDNPSLVDTGRLFDNIQYTIRDNRKKIVGSGT